MPHTIICTTALDIAKTVRILSEEMDPIPPLLMTRLRKTAPVCGRVDQQGFELRNGTFPMYSLRAMGAFQRDHAVTYITIVFREPPLVWNCYGRLMRRYPEDRRVILAFLAQWLDLTCR